MSTHRKRKNMASRISFIARAGRFISNASGSLSKAHWPQDAESLKSIEDDWDPQVGDARQELVLIGIDMDETALRARLDACLLSDAEMAQGPRVWHRFSDPFPKWSHEEESVEQARVD